MHRLLTIFSLILGPIAHAQSLQLQNTPQGEIASSPPGQNGLVICFHGAGGQAKAWTTKEKGQFTKDLLLAGYQVLCPTSLNREECIWNPEVSPKNPDIQNVDQILDNLQIPPNTPIFLVGHSNGTGMATRFAGLSKRKKDIKAAFLSHGAGGLAGAPAAYQTPTLMAYAENDPIVPYKQILAAAAHSGAQLYKIEDPNPRGPHKFQNLSTLALEFFKNP